MLQALLGSSMTVTGTQSRVCVYFVFLFQLSTVSVYNGCPVRRTHGPRPCRGRAVSAFSNSMLHVVYDEEEEEKTRHMFDNKPQKQRSQ